MLHFPIIIFQKVDHHIYVKIEDVSDVKGDKYNYNYIDPIF